MIRFLVLGFAAIFLSGNVCAAQWSRRTVLTADQPVEIPGMILEPGIYVVKLDEAVPDENTIQVFDASENRLLTSFAAVQDFSMRPDREIDFTFHEVAPDEPGPIRSWFYSGDPFGYEFVYPKTRALEIAKVSGKRVMGQDSPSGTIVGVTPTGKEISLVPKKVEVTLREKPGVAQPQSPPDALPPTAGGEAMLIVAGLLSLGTAGSLRMSCRE
jgi:hypothetical protein